VLAGVSGVKHLGIIEEQGGGDWEIGFDIIGALLMLARIYL